MADGGSSDHEYGFLKRMLMRHWWRCFGLALLNAFLFYVIAMELFSLWEFSDWIATVEYSETKSAELVASNRYFHGAAFAIIGSLATFPVLFCLFYRFVEKGRS